MKLEEVLTEQELEFYKKLDSKSINDLELDRLIQITEIANNYLHNIQSILNNNDNILLLKKVLYKFSRESQDSLSYLVTTNFFNNIATIEFNGLNEVLVFIVSVIDSKFNIANKYLEFIEKTNSTAKALIMCKQYSNNYNSLFDSKLLQAELILLEKTKELKESNNSNIEKRTITG